MFWYFLVLGQILLFLYKKKRQVLTYSTLYVFANIAINNFDTFRYQKKYDNRGNIYTHDLLTGKKWKNR